MKVGLLTKEYPPEIYGGAGVHVEYLSRELDRLADVDVEVYCFATSATSALVRRAYAPWAELPEDGLGVALQAVATDLRMAGDVGGVDLVHSHTWYANLGGHFAKLLYATPHVMTVHSLEPLRPWKAAQLGGGYALSSFCEKTAIEAADAIVAVSASMADDVLRVYRRVDASRVSVIHNGIDPEEFRPDRGSDVLTRMGIDADRPTVAWIGRVTAQKGIEHLLDMAALIDSDAQLVLLAGTADTPEIGSEMSGRAAALASVREGVHWISGLLPRPDVVQLLSHASVFVCPSMYEPFGLINLEAMACEVPVVATAVGGIPEIVVEGVTGYLVEVPDGYAGLGAALAERVNYLLSDLDQAEKMGRAGRQRVLDHFTWEVIAARTAALYQSLA